MNAFYVYIVQCADGSYYVGFAQDVAERVRTHNEGGGAAYTFRRRPIRLVYAEKHPSKAAAVARERQIKVWSSAKKEALIAGDARRLKRLSKSRS